MKNTKVSLMIAIFSLLIALVVCYNFNQSTENWKNSCCQLKCSRNTPTPIPKKGGYRINHYPWYVHAQI
jgi:hypothetical protein|uniref:Uncharacterized protein n=1 Tax=viral metagenome TaxID=1070528 RepID=A0A6C0E7V3_9ZZZZ